MCVREWRRRSWVKRKEKREKKGKEKKRRAEKNLFIQINGRTDGQIERHKIFIEMRYNTEQNSKSNWIE